jgi:hypothetical protein
MSGTNDALAKAVLLPDKLVQDRHRHGLDTVGNLFG